MERVRTAVVGAGAFGKQHLRVLAGLPDAELVAAVDTDEAKAREAAGRYGCAALRDASELIGKVEAAVVAVPTSAHAALSRMLLEHGIDVLVEKPIAPDLDSARSLAGCAEGRGRILQVGHLERFNPIVQAVREIVTLPLFFEVHRLSVFSPRSLDVDVVLDLMIHDIDVLLSLTGAMPEEMRAAGLAILSPKVDIANVRLAFPNGCVANLTASRVSTERVRKLRFFQPHEYVSLDYQRQEGAVFSVSGTRQISFRPLAANKQEPLGAELESFLACVRSRRAPLVGAADAMRALQVALEVMERIEQHLQRVASTVAQGLPGRQHTVS
ncbi:MAG: Gfo/Idh/MocA family oxidoreductase [Acidobacteria bacterium]|nr:Gfo/Idh/MocA family oxidoreductase [Acidobacteriota bacterium]